MSSSELPLVKGEIILEDAQRSFSGATVHVRLEDVRYADAPSRVVAEHTIRDVSHESGIEHIVSFTLYGDAPDEKGSYIVTAHLDLSGQGRITPGDYLSMESYPVLTHGRPSQVSVHLREVN